MTPLWTIDDMAAATGGRVQGDWGKVGGVSIDSRDIAPGDLFVALTDQRDGHEFVGAALQAGAAGALVSHRPEGAGEAAPLLLVDDVLDALRDLARAARDRVRGKVIAVTGSVGKTSTKDMLRHMLAGQGNVHAAYASFNNHWGVPLTLARMPAATDFAIVEIGMNHPGEISPLSRLTRPDVALITTVAAAHMAAFDSVDDIARAKAEIFDGLGEGGVAVLNADIETLPVLRESLPAGVEQVTFGAADNATWKAGEMVLGTAATTFAAEGPLGGMMLRIDAAGRHFALNALGALAAVHAAGGDAGLAAVALSTWTAPGGRGERHRIVLDGATGEGIELIDDAYNANPTSLRAALEVLGAAKPADGVGRVARGRRIAFLGDMLELGPDEAALHADIATDPLIAACDIVHCSGPLMKHLHDALRPDQQGIWTQDAAEMVAQLPRLIDAGDVVLVKGSKGSRISTVVDALKKMGQADVGA